LALPLALGCSESTQPVAPITIPDSLPPAVKGAIYDGPPGLYDTPSYHGITSRYVLYDDSTFALEFYDPRIGPFAYGGRYTRTNSQITFSWDGWSTAGPWGAQGTLRGDSLKVTYNLVMTWSDFIDGTYVRASPTR
jgi:hypothetical protein